MKKSRIDAYSYILNSRRFRKKIIFGTLEINIINTALKHMFPAIIFNNRHTLLLGNGSFLIMSDFAEGGDWGFGDTQQFIVNIDNIL